jgi:hypothetical protein
MSRVSRGLALRGFGDHLIARHAFGSLSGRMRSDSEDLVDEVTIGRLRMSRLRMRRIKFKCLMNEN